jgi:hypothetical protein
MFDSFSTSLTDTFLTIGGERPTLESRACIFLLVMSHQRYRRLWGLVRASFPSCIRRPFIAALASSNRTS